VGGVVLLDVGENIAILGVKVEHFAVDSGKLTRRISVP
jgi:hypothetical protein